MQDSFQRVRTVRGGWLLVLLWLTAALLPARVVDYELVIAPGGKTAADGVYPSRLAINGTSPGPVLRFREGDVARIVVKNALPRGETSIHWHGLLVPVSEDGVPHVTTPPIPAGGYRVFEFPLRQAGTYWYHSHTGMQEQDGVYGAIVIEPKEGVQPPADREEVIVLSDWTRESGDEVMRTLMRMSGAEWYAFKKGNKQTWLGALQAGAFHDWLKREWARQPAMDISDVAYDAFLMNGRRELHLGGRPGERVRVRLINAASSTYFYVESSLGPLTVVAADGPPVRPLRVPRLFIGMAETYDFLLTVPPSGRWEVRATAQDGSGYAAAWLGEGEPHPAAGPPPPDIYRMESMLDHALEEMDGGTTLSTVERPGAPYRALRSLKPTAFSPLLPRRKITLHLTGDMKRYLWSINGKTVREDGVIRVQRGEVLQLELINDTMMHHPMHLHGHFFRLVTEQGAYSPLKHTVDVPPMGRRLIEFEANEVGDWLFHCHLLYHMHMGMARVFSYEGQGPDHQPTIGGHAKDHFYLMLEGNVQSHMSMGMISLMNSRNDFLLSWDLAYGSGLDGMSHVNSCHCGGGCGCAIGGCACQGGSDKMEYEIDLAWKRYFSPNVSGFLGWRFTNEMEAKNRAFAGVAYRLPLLIQSTWSLDSEGDVRVTLEKEFPLTNRLTALSGVRYDTGAGWEWHLGAQWLLSKQFSLIAEYHSMHGFGAGLAFRF